MKPKSAQAVGVAQAIAGLALLVLAAAGCAGDSGSGSNSSSSTGADSTAPTFAGATGLTVQALTSMTVGWSAGDDDVTAPADLVYRVYRGAAAGGEDFTTPLATTAAGDTSYADATATAGKFFYVVRAVDEAGNEDANTAEVSGPASFATDIYAGLAIQSKCSGCHTGSGGSLPGSMNLSSASAAYAAWVNVVSVQCTNLKRVDSALGSSASYLINKLTGTGMCGNVSQMPKGGPFFSPTQINTVRAWIDQGAPNN